MGKILLLVLFTLSMGEPAKEDIEMMKEMMLEMNEKLARTEEDLSVALTDIATTKDDLATTKTALMELELEVSRVKEDPFIHACGSYSGWLTIVSSTIPYSSLLYSSTNMPGVGGLDTETGVFTAPHPGSYTVTWSTFASDDAGDDAVSLYLYKNGQRIQESRHVSSYSGPSGLVADQGGRTLVQHLALGDTLELYCDDCSAEIWYTTFCVSLSTPD